MNSSRRQFWDHNRDRCLFSVDQPSSAFRTMTLEAFVVTALNDISASK